MHTFEFGDLIVANKDARYNITYTGTKWVVIYSTGLDIYVLSQHQFEKYRKRGLSANRMIEQGTYYPVSSYKFDYLRSLIKVDNKSNAHVLERFDN